jgi:dihydroorotase
MIYDLLLKQGHVIDPSQAIDGIFDVGIKEGKILNLGTELDASESAQVLNLKEKYVCPGLVDLHGHWFEGSIYGIDPHIALNHGVTTVVDAGTCGFTNFPYFRKHTIDKASIRVLAFVHISCLGLHAPFAEELRDLSYARPKETARIIEKNRDVVVGVKIREGRMTGEHGIEALEKALEAARDVSLPMMVHISQGAHTREILRRLRPGDIITHCFQGRGDGITDPHAAALLPEVKAARGNGILFDVGHGCGSFSWDVARKAFEHAFYPDTISTDLHRYCVGDPFQVDLLSTLSKFRALGMTLNEMVLKCTLNPARAVGREAELGTLRLGGVADVLVFEEEDGEFEFMDTHFQTLKASKRLRACHVIRQGCLWNPDAHPISLRDLYDSDREVIDAMRPPAEKN